MRDNTRRTGSQRGCTDVHTRNRFSRMMVLGRPKLDSGRRAPGGGRRDRTDDLMLAKHALSQLSYAPDQTPQCGATKLVGLGRLELPTSRLSSARSNQLSYKPEPLGPARRRKADEEEKPTHRHSLRAHPRRKRNEGGAFRQCRPDRPADVSEEIRYSPQNADREGSSLERR
jgi:hypothetical protein